MDIHLERIEKIRSQMREKGWDAVIFTGSDPHGSEYPAPRWKQVRWLSGFGGEAGDIVVTAGHAGLWTDTRYFIEAGRVLPGTGIELHKTRVPGEVRIPKWLATEAFDEDKPVIAIAVDGLAQSLSEINEIKAALEEAGRTENDDERGYRIINVPDLADEHWEDRPRIPQTPIITLGEDLTGESRADKIRWIREVIKEKGCDAILLTALDEIAWILNVRGSDVDYNPIVISYLLVTGDEVSWFVRKGGPLDDETAASFDELSSDGVGILPYDEVDFALSSLEGGRVWVDPSTLNYNLYKALPSGAVFATSPICLRKALKNETEIAGMREAHMEDGLAMEKYLYWIERQLENGEIVDEYMAAEKLASLRAEIPGYKGDSFETISAYGEGAALPHYVTPRRDAPRLRRRGLYLCDSGGQYLFGTTDITRTIPLGPCTALEKEDYTLVLKGHIALARAIFPKGTAGCQIDLLARDPLWKSKRNFGHGTGHGVGFFLNVHEGPQDIRQNFNSQPLLPGMIVSDEPGIYREGLHGVRHESLLLVVGAGSNDFGEWLCFENLTLCHIDTSAVIRDLLSPEELHWLNDYNERVWRTLAPRLPSAVAEWLREKTRPI